MKLQKAIAQRQTQPPLRAILDEWSTGWGKPGTVGSGLNTAGVLNLLCREAETLGIEQAHFFQPVNDGGIRVGPLTASQMGKIGSEHLPMLMNGEFRPGTPITLCAGAHRDTPRLG